MDEKNEVFFSAGLLSLLPPYFLSSNVDGIFFSAPVQKFKFGAYFSVARGNNGMLGKLEKGSHMELVDPFTTQQK